MNLAIIGVTGLTGRMLLKILEERNFFIQKLWPVASENSVGKKIFFQEKAWKIHTIEEVIHQKIQVVIFATNADLSTAWAQQFVKKGTVVIDLSTAWRMHKNYALIVPEINAHLLHANPTIIANPNCSVIPLVMVLHAIEQQYTIQRIVVSTYQSVTGSGQPGVDQLMKEREKITTTHQAYPHPIDLNVIPHIDTFLAHGYTKEEMKIIEEPKKILQKKDWEITATTVRVPTIGGHALSITIDFDQSYNLDLDQIKQQLQNTPGIVVQDESTQPTYPTPWHVKDKDEVFVGRIRKAFSKKEALNLWIVADNLRKGAATNAVQILEAIIAKNND